MTQKSKKFTQAPLPFMGQKRRFLNQVKQVLGSCPDDATYVDLFGGSGLLSHTIKQHYPTAKVVYNDYDNYRLRLENVGHTNRLISDIRAIVADCQKDKRIVEPQRGLIIKRVLQEEKEKGYVDYITLSSNVLFSMKYVQSYAELEKKTLYNCIRMSDYIVKNYLEGVVVESLDYKDLFSKYRLVITDRYYGTIFAQIVSTPTIVISSNDHKLSSGVKWFPQEDFGDKIFFAKNLNEAFDLGNKILSDKQINICDSKYFENNYWSKLKSILN